MPVFLIAGESVEKVTRLTSFACGVLQLTGKFVRSSNFFKWSSDRVLLKSQYFAPHPTLPALNTYHLHCDSQKTLW